MKHDNQKQAGIVMFLGMAALVFAGCAYSGADGLAAEGGEEIRFALSIGGTPSRARVATDTNFNSLWEDGDQVGLYAVRHTSVGSANLAGSGNYINNGQLTRSSGSWTMPTPLYYPAGTEQLDFYAYYPRQGSVGNATNMSFTVKTDQSAITNYNQSDLLVANTMNVARSPSLVSLAFTHAMALVEVEVTNAKTETTVTLLGVKPTAKFSLQAQTVTADGTAVNIKMARVSGTNLFRALVPPQTIASGSTLFLFDDSGKGSMYVLSAALTLTKGKAEKYTITL